MADFRHAIYAGSFDPITYGHTAIIERAARLYDKVTVGIGINPKKSGLFTVEEREEMIRASLTKLPNVEVDHFEGLLVDFCKKTGAGVIVRGLRLLTDFEYEFQLGLANRDISPGIETVFLLTEHEYVWVSSSLVKEIASNGGDIGRYVPPAVRDALAAKL